MDAQRAIARRLVIGLPPDGLSAPWERDFAAYPPAGVILFRRDFRDLEDLRRVTSRLRELARPRRLFISMDEEGGWVSQLAGHLTVPPNAALLARGAGPGDVEWASRVTGERLRALGLDWVFAPVADIHSLPENPVIGPRAYGTTVADTSRAVAEACKGLRQAGVASCLKHFPGHGDTALDSHLALPTSSADRETLEQREIAPFRANLGADSVMTAHVVYPALDREHPATFSRAIVTGLLRDRLGFGGVCITDALEMKGAAGGDGALGAARQALEAGCDLLLFAFHDEALRRVRLELARALMDGAIDRTAFDAARPRLAALDHAHTEPTATELAKPLESLTPADWEPRLLLIIERGLQVSGTWPLLAGGVTFEVRAPEFPHGPGFADQLRAAGLPITAVIPQATAPTAASGAPAAIEVYASRTPIATAELSELRARCRERPTVLIGLQNDAFLEWVPEAVLRISAADAPPLTRRAVAAAVAGKMQYSSGTFRRPA